MNTRDHIEGWKKEPYSSWKTLGEGENKLWKTSNGLAPMDGKYDGVYTNDGNRVATQDRETGKYYPEE